MTANEDANIDRAITGMIQVFEQRWYQNREYLIEDLLKTDFDQLLQQFELDPRKPEVQNCILLELIHVESNMCFGLTGDEYSSTQKMSRLIELQKILK